MVMKSQAILNKTKQSKITVIAPVFLFFFSIDNKTFPLSSSDRSWTVADSKTQFLAYYFKLSLLLSRSLLS